jgi:hypothetical protein
MLCRLYLQLLIAAVTSVHAHAQQHKPVAMPPFTQQARRTTVNTMRHGCTLLDHSPQLHSHRSAKPTNSLRSCKSIVIKSLDLLHHTRGGSSQQQQQQCHATQCVLHKELGHVH